MHESIYSDRPPNVRPTPKLSNKASIPRNRQEESGDPRGKRRTKLLYQGICPPNPYSREKTGARVIVTKCNRTALMTALSDLCCSTLSLCHFVTLSLCHFVTLSLCHFVTLSLCHFVTIQKMSAAVSTVRFFATEPH